MRALVRDEPPDALAALRIVVPIMLLLSSSLRHGVEMAGVDRALWVVPEGLHAFVAWVPVSHPLALGVEAVTVFAALLAIVGVRARPALAVMTVGALYLFALAALSGFVWHEMHLLWLGALLAASPCDHAWALDAKRPATPARSYGVALQLARGILGCVYLFPGIHKLAAQGLGWALSDNLVNQLRWKWFEHGEVPAFRLDQHPMLLAAGGLAVLLFEVTALPLFLVPRTRRWAALAGVLFHLSTQALFQIPFVTLWACYVVLLDVGAIAAKVGLRPKMVPELRQARLAPSVIVAALVLGGVVAQGVRGQTQSFPFACYPTFADRPGTAIPDLRIVAGDRELAHARDGAGRRTQRQWGTIWALAGVTAPVDEARLRAYYATIPGAPRGVEVRFVRAWRSVVPEDAGAVVSEDELVRFTP